MTINDVFKLLKYRANKAGYNGYISGDDFNLLFNAAQIRYFNKLFGNQNEYQVGNPIPRIAYPETLKVSTSLAKFGSVLTSITIDSAGKYNKPDDMFYIDSLSHTISGIPAPIKRVEKMDLADNLYSYYEVPTEKFPIYVEFDTFIQFYPITLATANLTYLKKPTTTNWAYMLNGGVGTITITNAGTGYVDGTYTNVPFGTNGSGSGLLATVTVSGGTVASVVLTNPGVLFAVANTLTITNTFLGGSGSGFAAAVSSIKNPRQVYNSTGSIDPLWSDVDIDEIVYLCLQDIGINMRDNDLAQFSAMESKTGGS